MHLSQVALPEKWSYPLDDQNRLAADLETFHPSATPAQTAEPMTMLGVVGGVHVTEVRYPSYWLPWHRVVFVASYDALTSMSS